MVKFTDSQRKIVVELIRNPRISDNQIAKNTGIPVMTVNRKRKALERIGVLRYFTYIDLGQDGMQMNHARQLYNIRLKAGITREIYLAKSEKEKRLQKFNRGHVVESYLGENEGLLSLIMIVEAETQRDLVEVFNGEIIPSLRKRYGEDAIVKITTTQLNDHIRYFRNYLPKVNMDDAKIRQDWPDELIFIDR